MKSISISKENYLKFLFKSSQEKKENVTTTMLSKSLKISNAAVSEMSKKMSSDGYVFYEKYKGVNLTEKGNIYALKIIRRHRLWETFLVNTLGLKWDEVHDEAEVLEHHTSDLLIEKIYQHLGCPKFDPHGDPIPDENGILPQMPKLIKLSEVELGKVYLVGRVKDKDNQIMNYLTRIKLRLKQKIRISEAFEFDNSIEVIIKKKSHILSEKVADCIYVKEINEEI